MSYRRGPRETERSRILPKEAPYTAEEFLADLDRYNAGANYAREDVWDFHAERYGDLEVAADAPLTFDAVLDYLHRRMQELERLGLVEVVTVEVERLPEFAVEDEAETFESPKPTVPLAERLLSTDRLVKTAPDFAEYVALDEAAADRAARELSTL